MLPRDELYDLYFDTMAENEELKEENEKLKALWIRDSMRMDRTDYDYNPSYRCGYDDGYDDGYHAACEIWQKECQQVRDTLSAMLDATINGGEAPAHEVTDQASR